MVASCEFLFSFVLKFTRSIILTSEVISSLVFPQQYLCFQLFDHLLSSLLFSSTAIGIRCKDGVVFGVEKLVLSKLYEEGSNKRIFNVDRHVGMVMRMELAFIHHHIVSKIKVL